MPAIYFVRHRQVAPRRRLNAYTALQTDGNAFDVLSAMLRAHALALFENHTFESVVIQGVQLHRFGSTTPAQREELDMLIAIRDRFEESFKKQLRLAKKDGLLGDVAISIARPTRRCLTLLPAGSRALMFSSSTSNS